MTIVVRSEMRFCISHEEEYWQMSKKKWNRNSPEPMIEIMVVLDTVTILPDTAENQVRAKQQAETIFAITGDFVEVVLWGGGRVGGQGIYKRTTGHCYGEI